MKNEKLKSLMAKKIADSAKDLLNDAEILNKTELLFAIGGASLSAAPGGPSCPNLTSCGTFSNCNDKCGVKGITIEPHL
jgi:hypothetical protein